MILTLLLPNSLQDPYLNITACQELANMCALIIYTKDNVARTASEDACALYTSYSQRALGRAVEDWWVSHTAYRSAHSHVASGLRKIILCFRLPDKTPPHVLFQFGTCQIYLLKDCDGSLKKIFLNI